MSDFSVYEDIANRTGGDIYIGVVGPVRTGKSTFIKRFMQEMVLPQVAEGNKKTIMIDELPQAGEGKTVMTTEPKFVPSEAVKIKVGENGFAKVRLIDCVGFAADGAEGFTEEDLPRRVKTPWSEELMPFELAAEIGTDKVINEHSSIAVLVTCDGSISQISRAGYIAAEEKAVERLKAIGKPFVVLLNCKNPHSEESGLLASSLEEKYSAPVMRANAESMGVHETSALLEKLLYAFPVASFDVKLPKWLQVLPPESKIISELIDDVKALSKNVCKMSDLNALERAYASGKLNCRSVKIELGSGRAECVLAADEQLFYKILSEESGEDICDDYKLMSYVKQVSKLRGKYERVALAFENAEKNGYGVVYPADSEYALTEPKLIKNGTGYGVKIKANAPSYHIMKIDVDGEVTPVVGTEAQSSQYAEELIKQLEANSCEVWETNIFGKSLKTLMREGLTGKIEALPPEVQTKLRRAVTRIVNEAKGGVICILL